jgi:hypothetical protein
MTTSLNCGTTRVWIAARDPTSTENTGTSQNGVANAPIERFNFWYNTATGNMFQFTGDTPGFLTSIRIASSTDINTLNASISALTTRISVLENAVHVSL